MSISILGAGAFGTALAVSLAGKGQVCLWARSASDAKSMSESRINGRRLPDVKLPDAMKVTADIEIALQSDVILLAVPMQKLRRLLQDLDDRLSEKTLVSCCKGIELTTGSGPIEVIGDVLPNAQKALLTGPSFAQDIAQGLPTALTLACPDLELCKSLQGMLSTENLRLYRTTDTRGAELGGALKNVVAIGCGAVIGAGLGDSARAALMTRGYAEMVRYASRQGAAQDTLAGLSGFGDLTLTCTSELSRNFRLGLAIGRGERFDPDITVEGAATARAVSQQAKMLEIEMPISDAVVQLLDQTWTVTEATKMLLARSLKEE